MAAVGERAMDQEARRANAKKPRKKYLSPKAGSPLTPLATPKPLANAKPPKDRPKRGFLHDVEKAVGDAAHVIYPRGNGKKGKGTVGASAGVPTAVGGGPTRAAKNIGIALGSKPGPTVKNTLTGTRDIVAAIPSGIVAAATTRPDRTLKKVVDDYQQRYGETDKQMVKRFQTKGFAPELFDASLLATGGGAAGGRAVSKLAGTGKLGTRAKVVATAPRPALRTSGGLVVPQVKSKNYIRAEGQHARDARRVRKQGKAELGVENVKPMSPVRAEVARRNAAAGKVVETTHAGLPLIGKGEHANAKAQRIAVATTKGRAVNMRKSEQNRIVEKTARRLINQFTPHERRAFYYVASGNVSGDASDLARIEAQLRARRQAVEDARASKGTPPMAGLKKNTDELRTIDKLLPSLRTAFTPRVLDTVKALRAVDIHTGRGDPALTAQQRLLRRYSQQAETLGLSRGVNAEKLEGLDPARLAKGEREVGALYDPSEGTAAYIRRVQAEAAKQGLERPLYFPSEKYDSSINPDRAAYAVGGSKAVRAPFHYTGALFRTGRQDTRPEVYLTGLARSIKRKHNWDLAIKQLDDHAFEGLKHQTISQLRSKMTDLGMDVQGAAFWNANIYRKTLEEMTPNSEKKLNRETAEWDAAVQEGDDFGQASTGRALTQSLVLPEHVTSDLVNRPGWSVIPRPAYQEIMQAAQAGGPLQAAGRVWDISKSKQSRILLGTLNFPWLAFQVASNTLLATGATAGRLPIALVEQAKWYKGLKPAEQDYVNALVGDASGHANAENIKLGASSNADIVNGYRALKANPIWDRPIFKGHGPSTRQLNPIEAMFTLDAKQNAPFRRAVLYDRMKREAASQMADSIRGLRDAQDGVVKAVDSDPKQLINAMIKDKPLMEQHASYVDQWLGNWTTFTQAERRSFNRVLMFYPFLRFSLKLAFQTLPWNHPVMASIVGKLGQLQHEELVKLGFDKLPWTGGRLYFTRGGKLQSVDLARMNPAANALTSIQELSQLTGLLPPVVSALLDQVFHRSAYKDREWAVGGNAANPASKGSDYAMSARARILLDDMASLAYPYREAKKLAQLGPQGDDSLLLSPRPTVYKKKDLVKSVNASVAKQKERSVTSRLLSDLVPLVGAPTADDEIAKQQLLVNKARPKKKRRKDYFGKGSFGKGSFGKGSFGD